jgi:3',5'-cyclic AMP phosphodiesterase CpdA
VLNSSDISIPGNAEDSPKYLQAKQMCEQFKKEGKPNGVPWCAAIGKEQLQWLKGVLAKASECNERAIVFAHHSLLPKTSSSLWNTDEIVDVLEKSGCVEAYICGHAHDGAYASLNGIRYITIDGMVETPDKNAYALFNLYSDRFEIKGYGRVKSRTFPINMNSAEINKLQK